MPTYAYKCVCGHAEDQVRPVAERDEYGKCPKCGSPEGLERDVVASMQAHTDKGYDTPVLSSTLGVPPNQIREAQQRFPHHEFAPDGRMIIRSHTDRKRIMRELGFFDKDGY